MDLAVSPDLDAFCSYGVVFICALIAARVQIYQRLSENKIYGIWLDLSTWVVFGTYLTIPLVLFWLLDRLGALHDTSVFAALLVGCAYPAVLAGGWGGVKAPDNLAGLLKPIERFTDALMKRVLDKSTRRDKRFEDYVVGEMLRQNTSTFDDVLKFVKNRATGATGLDNELAAIDAAAPQPPDPVLIREKKARHIYLYLSSIPDYQSLIREKKLLAAQRWGRGLYYVWNAPLYRNRIVSTAVTVLLLGVLIAAATFIISAPRTRLAYVQWRLVKPNNTELDRFRNHERMKQYVRDPDQTTAERARASVARSLRTPGLRPESVDLLVRLMLEARGSPATDQEVADLLISALRVDNVDTRSRVHQALSLIASESDPFFEQSKLASWNPLKSGDSVASLEQWIDLWHDYWHAREHARTSIERVMIAVLNWFRPATGDAGRPRAPATAKTAASPEPAGRAPP